MVVVPHAGMLVGCSHCLRQSPPPQHSSKMSTPPLICRDGRVASCAGLDVLEPLCDHRRPVYATAVMSYRIEELLAYIA